MNILIVEDEAIVALELKRVVLKMGYGVSDTVGSYDEALASIAQQQPNLILLDINLHGHQDGIKLAQAIAKKALIPIIYLSAFCDDNTLQRAIQTNPMGYLVKPFKRETLKSTIELAIYKLQNSALKTTDGYFELGQGYRYDLDNHNLFYQDHPVKLSTKEKKFLEILIEAKGTIVPFEVLQEHLWGSKGVSESSLRTLIYRLRTKLEYKLIETIPSFGVKLKN